MDKISLDDESRKCKKIGHPAPFPEELPRRLIKLYSFTDDIVLDPFMGSGTTAVSSLKEGRNFVGYEINEDYIELANKRIAVVKQESITLF